MEAISFKEVVIHWADMVVNQMLPLINAMVHVVTGAFVYWFGSKFGGAR
jgi:hypothetical protein